MKLLRAWSLFAVLGLAACAAKVETHSSVGVIRGFGNEGKTVVLEHRAFPDGFMDAMTMTFELGDPKLADGLKVGDSVDFTLTHRDDAYLITVMKKTK